MKLVRTVCTCGLTMEKSLRLVGGRRQTVFACPNYPTGNHLFITVDEGTVYEVQRESGRKEVGVGGR